MSSDTSSITDQPVQDIASNLLGIESYAEALTGFISDSATPLTIGLQGQWGTGKTSLMNLVRELLDKKSVATSWVNTWEYSLFRTAEQTTPVVLKGMLESLKEDCGDSWPIADDRMRKVRGLFAAATNAASQVVRAQTGINTSEMVEAGFGKDVAEVEIVLLRREIEALITQLIEDRSNPYQMVVFFLDDLDRIDPPVAVDILEALKNVFDIPNCIFVLAIDYDVVVKGLEKKFGPKTDENEREFRSFFDKIIQVPFAMPLGAYRIDRLFSSLCGQLRLEVPADLERDYLEIVRRTVGVVPRGIKRFVNSYSLLTRISNANDDQLVRISLFATLGIQIAYPKIYALLAERPDFQEWGADFARDHDVDLKLVAAEIGEQGELLDEPWEQIIWAICRPDPWLRARSQDLLMMLNRLREISGDRLSELMDQSMDASSVTRISEPGAAADDGVFDPDERWANRQVCKALQQELNNELPAVKFSHESAEITDGKPFFRLYQARGTDAASLFFPVNLDQWPDKYFTVEFSLANRRRVLMIWAGNRKSQDYRDEWIRKNAQPLGLPAGAIKPYQRHLVFDEASLDYAFGRESVDAEFRTWVRDWLTRLFDVL